MEQKEGERVKSPGEKTATRGTRRGTANHPNSSSMIIRQQIRGFPLSGIPEACTPYFQKEAQPMMKPNAGLANKGIERILELSADAHIQRREAAKDSPEFHSLTGAIAAYGKALALLTALQEWEEFYAMIGQYDVPADVAPC
jgi:hypothetical protein